MVKTYELLLNDGSKEKLTFDFNFLVVVSGIMEDREKYPDDMDETLMQAAKIVDDGIKFSQLNKLVSLLFPFVYGAIQATIDNDKLNRTITEEDVKQVLKSIKEPAALGFTLGYTFDCIAPKGLPEEKGKKKAVPAKKASR
jgi:hypothetical protein